MMRVARVAVPLVLMASAGLALACPGEKMEKDAKAALTQPVAQSTAPQPAAAPTAVAAAPAQAALIKATAKAAAPKAPQGVTVLAAKKPAGA